MDGYGKRVLVVEDDDDVRTLISVILRDTGYNVYEACDGLEAIDALKKRRYDVLLTDYHMPKMDGLELLDLTRSNVARIACDPRDERCLIDRADSQHFTRTGLCHPR